MSFTLIFKPLAEAEIAAAYAWYARAEIGKGAEFLDELERVERFIRSNPFLYARVEDEVRRAAMKRFPYSLFYVIDGETIAVISCFHQSRDPEGR